MKNFVCVVGGLAATLLVGCGGHAQLVKRDLTGGTYALKGDREEAMNDAHSLMAEHCKGNYTIVAEEEAVVGQQTASQDNTSVRRGWITNSGTATTTNVTEYRITYVCGAPAGVQAAQPAPAGPAPAAPPPSTAAPEPAPNAAPAP